MDQNVEKGAMAEERGEHRDSIGDAGKIWMGADGESLDTSCNICGSKVEGKTEVLKRWVVELGAEKTRSTRKEEITYQCSVPWTIAR